MPDIYNIPGGKKLTNFHPDTSVVKPTAMPHEVAGEYGRGDFTLGVPFVPSLATRQNDQLNGLNLDPAAPFVPFVVWLVAVPAEHSSSACGIRVEPDVCDTDGQIRCIPPKCGWIEPTGFSFEIVRQRVDNAVLEDTGDIEAAKLGSPAVIGTTPLDLDSYSFERVALAQHVAADQTMLVGVRVITPPDAGADKISALQCRITPVVKVGNFGNPLQIM